LKILPLLFCSILVTILVTESPAVAHPISLTEAVVDVQQDRVDVELKVLVEDLVLYYPVSANEDDIYPADSLRHAAQSHHKFVLDGLRLLDENGKLLSGKVTSVNSSNIVDKGVALTEIKQFSVTYSLQYSTNAKPDFLTVSQSFGGEKATLPAMMDCQVKQQGVVLDISQPLLSGQSLTTRFDWTKPPTPPKNWRELKEQRSERLKQQLGIASYSGLYSFFYITPHEVRHEILIPLLTIDEWITVKRNDEAFLEVDEQKAAASQVADFFRKGNPVSINGSVVKPIVARVNFFGLDIRDFAMNAEPRRVSVAQARVGIMLSYPSEKIPSKIHAEWETFNRFAPFLKSVIYEFNNPSREHFFRPGDVVFDWAGTNSDQQSEPAVKAISSTDSAPSSDRAEQIAHLLIRNVYRAFDFQGERETYDALSAFVDGPLLRSLYLQIRRSLLMAEQGGSRSRVLEVQPVSGIVTGAPSLGEFQVDLCWRVSGEVEHWGHIHTRENEYVGRLSVKDADGFWKLTELKFLGQKRVRFETRLRE
tara:strand:+ start:174242 stop:175846 length:1605 start_codon:yes stop_codon:yes gene_type:complete